MSSQRRARILALLVSDGSSPIGGRALCDMANKATGLTGAGIMILSDGRPQGSLGFTDDVSGLIEQLHFTLGEGPCIDAYSDDKAVTEPDLAEPEVPRWPAFSGPAVASGALAVFGFPIRVGAARIGALSLYRDRVGSLTGEQHADSLVAAQLIAEAILALQAEAEPGEVAEALRVDADFHYVEHQASGMIAVQLRVGIDEALVRLRAHAFRSSTSVTDVARKVVGRSLRFDDLADGDGPIL